MLLWISRETASRIVPGAGATACEGENKVQSLLGPASFEGLEEQGVPRASNFVPFGT